MSKSNPRSPSRAAERTHPGVSRGAFGTDHDELFIELLRGRPTYIRLNVGSYLQEGDAFHRTQTGPESPTVATWEVVEVTPDVVVGRDIHTGDERQWERAELETKLAVGTYSTSLTDFEWISVYQAGSWADYHPEVHNGGTRFVARPYVAVVAYGDNGLKYGSRYRFTSPESNELVLWKRDAPAGGFSDDVEARLDDRIREALAADGYRVVSADAYADA